MATVLTTDAIPGATTTAWDLTRIRTDTHVLEILSDPGEGAQRCGQIFGTVSAKMGNGVWTVEIIPAEIQPPARDPAGASGNRVRIGNTAVTNWGDATQLVVAFNEQVLLGRQRLGALASDTVILLENKWAVHADPSIRAAWSAALEELRPHGYRLIEVPMEAECLQVVDDAAKGKNMFALGLLSCVYERDLEKMREQIAFAFRKKAPAICEKNVALLERGYAWADANLDFRVCVDPRPAAGDLVVMNGNQAAALGAIAAGMELAAMYPITPATSVSHYLGEIFEKFGGTLHQAEDEIAAAGVALGASYAGKVAFTITSGPGLALKTEFLGLAVMTETPLVVLDVQRGGPSTACRPRSSSRTCWRHSSVSLVTRRTFAVVICSPHDAETSDNTLMNVFCTEIGDKCTGTLCPLCAKSTDVMREELAASRGE